MKWNMNGGTFFWRCVLIAVLGMLLLGVVTMLLWNWLVPVLFSGPEVTFLQALGLLVLTKLITWGFWGRHRHGYHGKGQPYWKKRFADKLNAMNPEEREAFKQKMKEKWCSWEKDASEGGSND